MIKYSASSIPVIQLALSSTSLPEQTVFDAAVNQLRPQLVTIPGVAIPFPYGGKIRLISVDLDVQALQSRGMAPVDVVNAINTQNLVLPSGTAKFGETEFNVRMNGSPDAISGLNDLPVRTAAGATREPTGTLITSVISTATTTNSTAKAQATGLMRLKWTPW